MKIKKTTLKNKAKLVNLQILKFKLYKKGFTNQFKKTIQNEKIKLYLKKVIKIIYEYYVSRKKILFLNFPKLITKKIKLSTYKTNNSSIFFLDSTFSNKHFTNNFDLIVLFEQNNKKLINFKKNYFYKVPIIVINDNLNYEYKVLGNLKFLEKQIIDNFLFSILKSLFKKSKLKQKINNLKFKLVRKKRKKFKKFNVLKHVFKKKTTI